MSDTTSDLGDPGAGLLAGTRVLDLTDEPLAQAGRLATSVAITHSAGLSLDLDVIDDLETYQHMEPGLLERLTGHPAATPGETSPHRQA